VAQQHAAADLDSRQVKCGARRIVVGAALAVHIAANVRARQHDLARGVKPGAEGNGVSHPHAARRDHLARRAAAGVSGSRWSEPAPAQVQPGDHRAGQVDAVGPAATRENEGKAYRDEREVQAPLDAGCMHLDAGAMNLFHRGTIGTEPFQKRGANGAPGFPGDGVGRIVLSPGRRGRVGTAIRALTPRRCPYELALRLAQFAEPLLRQCLKVGRAVGTCSRHRKLPHQVLGVSGNQQTGN
jgi:hypothetical protein